MTARPRRSFREHDSLEGQAALDVLDRIPVFRSISVKPDTVVGFRVIECNFHKISPPLLYFRRDTFTDGEIPVFSRFHKRRCRQRLHGLLIIRACQRLLLADDGVQNLTVKQRACPDPANQEPGDDTTRRHPSGPEGPRRFHAERSAIYRLCGCSGNRNWK